MSAMLLECKHVPVVTDEAPNFPAPSLTVCLLCGACLAAKTWPNESTPGRSPDETLDAAELADLSLA